MNCENYKNLLLWFLIGLNISLLYHYVTIKKTILTQKKNQLCDMFCSKKNNISQ